MVKQDPFFDFIRHGETEMEDIRFYINIFPLSPLSALKDVFSTSDGFPPMLFIR